MPSVYEPFGNALLEAMAAGLPSIALRPGLANVRTAANEILNDLRTGFLVSGESPEELAQKLDLLVSNPQLRAEVGSAGQIVCRNKYNWSACASQYLDILSIGTLS